MLYGPAESRIVVTCDQCDRDRQNAYNAENETYDLYHDQNPRGSDIVPAKPFLESASQAS